MHTPIYILIEESVFNLVSCQGFEDDKKVPVFLYVMGSKTYSFLQNLVSPNLTQDITFEQLVAILKRHFKPKPVDVPRPWNSQLESMWRNYAVFQHTALLDITSSRHSKTVSYAESIVRIFRR